MTSSGDIFGLLLAEISGLVIGRGLKLLRESALNSREALRVSSSLTAIPPDAG